MSYALFAFFRSNSFFFAMGTLIAWSLVYVIILFSGFQSRKQHLNAIPVFSSARNLAWEIAAALHTHVIGYYIWLILDLGIAGFAIRNLDSKKKRAIYIASIIILTPVFLLMFKHFKSLFFPSAFFIDVLMTLEYLACFKKMAPTFKLPIAALKLLGSLSAGFAYGYDQKQIAIMALLSLLFNTIYLVRCIQEKLFLKRKKASAIHPSQKHRKKHWKKKR